MSKSGAALANAQDRAGKSSTGKKQAGSGLVHLLAWFT